MSTRSFEYTDGRSHKFWRITLDGSAHTVAFGRIGTAGQTQTKELATEAEARKACEKLIAEKLRKGYVEVGAAGAKAVDRPLDAAVRDGGSVAGDHLLPPAGAPFAPDTGTSPPAPAAPGPNTQTPEHPDTFPPERRLDLEPIDWLWATWRPRTPLPRPEPAPFDPGEALSRLRRVTTGRYGWEWDWSKAEIVVSLAREEALFWFTAMVRARTNITPRQLVTDLVERPWLTGLDLDGAETLIASQQQMITPDILIPLVNLFPAEALIDRLLAYEESACAAAPPQPEGLWSALIQIVTGLRNHVLPYLDETEREALRAHLRPRLDPAAWPPFYYAVPSVSFHLAAALGCHDEMRTLVTSWPDDHYSGGDWHDHYHRPQEIVFGLGDATHVEAEMRRLKLRLRRPEYIRAWLAHTEYGALDLIRDTILGITNKDEAETLIATFALPKAPEAAPHMLELMLSSKAPRPAREWLETNPGHAIAGLLPIAAGRGTLAEASVQWLRSLKRKGHGGESAAALADQPAEVAERVKALVLDVEEREAPPFDATTTPAWLRDALVGVEWVRGAAKPKWIEVADLPPIRAGERRLSDEQVEAVLVALWQSAPGNRRPLLTALKTHAEAVSLDAFAWRLFELWLREGAPSKEKWALLAVGMLGSDAVALKLTPLVRTWPGESQHARAVLGLECLRAIGTDTALMQIHGIAQRVPFKGLKAKAMECMEAIAAERGMSRAELEDRIVPDCGLDESGSRLFDFGPRRFHFVLGSAMKPMVRDETGAVKPDLPKPGAKDDAALAGQAVAEWKLLKKQVAEIVKIQVFRLEQAMVTGRRWTVAEFESLLLRHPLMSHLVPRVVWQAYDAEGRPSATFRVTEDRSYAGAADGTLTLDGCAHVGIAHPFHLSEAERAAWGEILSDYEIVPPFPQLGRPLHRLEPGEVEAVAITRFAHLKVPAPALVGTLDRLGWNRGLAQDAAMFYEHSKPFYGAGVTAIVEYEEGVIAGMMRESEDQQITRCFFVAGIYRPADWGHPEAVPLSAVDPVVISEVLGDLTAIAAKEK